jgi:hypothetical protein
VGGARRVKGERVTGSAGSSEDHGMKGVGGGRLGASLGRAIRHTRVVVAMQGIEQGDKKVLMWQLLVMGDGAGVVGAVGGVGGADTTGRAETARSRSREEPLSSMGRQGQPQLMLVGLDGTGLSMWLLVEVVVVRKEGSSITGDVEEDGEVAEGVVVEAGAGAKTALRLMLLLVVVVVVEVMMLVVASTSSWRNKVTMAAAVAAEAVVATQGVEGGTTDSSGRGKVVMGTVLVGEKGLREKKQLQHQLRHLPQWRLQLLLVVVVLGLLWEAIRGMATAGMVASISSRGWKGAGKVVVEEGEVVVEEGEAEGLGRGVGMEQGLVVGRMEVREAALQPLSSSSRRGAVWCE